MVSVSRKWDSVRALLSRVDTAGHCRDARPSARTGRKQQATFIAVDTSPRMRQVAWAVHVQLRTLSFHDPVSASLTGPDPMRERIRPQQRGPP